MTAFESAELVELFTTYTAGPSSIGAHLADTVVRETAHDPLLIATGTDLALFPGDDSAPGAGECALGSNRHGSGTLCPCGPNLERR